VQVSYANDDSFEWFGGSVNCKHLIAYRGLDDDFDTDNGFNGKIQFGIAMRDPQIADISRSEAFECDNDANGTDRKTYVAAIPVSANNPVAIVPVKTSAVFSNMTLVGPYVTPTTTVSTYYLAGAQIRRNAEQSIYNSVFVGWSDGITSGLLIDGNKGIPTDLNLAPTGGLNFQNNIIAGTVANAVKYAASTTAPTGATTSSITTWVKTASFNNSLLATNDAAGLTNPFALATPDFNPSSATAAAATGAAFTDAKLKTKTSNVDDFTVVTYKGACAVGDTWWKNWTKFN